MGHWEPVVSQVWETVVTPCRCCGQVVPRRLWKAEVGSEELYRVYVLQKLR